MEEKNIEQAKEKKDPQLDPKGKYLIKDDGHIYPWTEALSKRKDMKPYDPETGRAQFEPVRLAEKTVSIELQGKTFMVRQELYDVLVDMGNVMVELQEKNKEISVEKENFAAFKERLETDNLDLTEQLGKANAMIKALEEKYAATAEGKDEELQAKADKTKKKDK